MKCPLFCSVLRGWSGSLYDLPHTGFSVEDIVISEARGTFFIRRLYWCGANVSDTKTFIRGNLLLVWVLAQIMS